MTQLEMEVLSLSMCVLRVANLDVEPDDVVLKIPGQRRVGSFPLHAVD